MMGIMASNDDKLEGSAGMGKIGRSYPRFDEALVDDGGEKPSVTALDGDVGAVGAVVQQKKLVVARFEGAVLPRRQLVGDHQVAGLGPADHDARVVLP